MALSIEQANAVAEKYWKPLWQKMLEPSPFSNPELWHRTYKPTWWQLHGRNIGYAIRRAWLLFVRKLG